MDKAIYRGLNDFASHKKSRRAFIRTVSALGMTPLAADTLMGFMQRDSQGATALSGDFEMMEGTAGALFVAQLHAAGVRYVFYSSGSGNSAILDELVDRKDMHPIVLPFEGQGVAAAAGHALASEGLAFFVCAAEGNDNMGTNLNNAFNDQVPMIVSSPGGEPAIKDAYTSWHTEVTNGEQMPEMLRRAIKFAVAPPGSPVAMTLSGNAQLRKIKAPIFKMGNPVKNRPIYHAPKESIEMIARALIEAKTPLVIAGREITRSHAIPAMVALAEKLSLPVAQSHRRDNLYADFPSDHQLFMESFLDPMRNPPNVDLLVNFGANMGNHHLDDAKLIHVSFNPANLENMGSYKGEVPVLADVGQTIKDVSDAIDGLVTKDRLEKIRRERLDVVKGYHQQRVRAREAALRGVFDETPISWERLGYELEKNLDKNAMIVPEIGSQDQKIYQHMVFGPDAKGRIGRTTGGQLGWGLGTSLGVSLAMPDRQVVALLGDGGMLFGQTEALWSLSRYNAPIMVVILNNRGYNEIRVRNLVASVNARQFVTGHEQVSYLGSPDVNFAKMAEAYDIKGEQVKDPNQLGAAIQRGIKVMRDGRPYMLDVELGREGVMAESTWHPGFSIAGLRRA